MIYIISKEIIQNNLGQLTTLPFTGSSNFFLRSVELEWIVEAPNDWMYSLCCCLIFFDSNSSFLSKYLLSSIHMYTTTIYKIK